MFQERQITFIFVLIVKYSFAVSFSRNEACYFDTFLMQDRITITE